MYENQDYRNSVMRQSLMSMWRKGLDITPGKFVNFFFLWSDRFCKISMEEAQAFLFAQKDFDFNA